MAKSRHFDVLIVGAGPSGCSAAIELAKANVSVALFDKASFPRDKTCGDALSVDVVNQLEKLSADLLSEFVSMAAKISSHGVRIFSPDAKVVALPFRHDRQDRVGYICKRTTFDALLLKHARQRVSMFENCDVTDVAVSPDDVKLSTSSGTFTGKVVLGADGAHSLIKRKLVPSKIERSHHSAGLRVYYKNVSGFNSGNYIDLYFFKDILPGYCWIFQLPNGEANVGLGMLSEDAAKRKVNLTKTLERLIATHPSLQERFANASPLESIKGHGLPLGWSARKISGDRSLLLGDAAGLIDPFSGEGIGNALRSGRVAAEHVLGCLKQNSFTESTNLAYDREIYRRLGKEFALGNGLLKLSRRPWLFNLVVDKAVKSRRFHEMLINALANPEQKSWLVKPMLYFRLLFGS